MRATTLDVHAGSLIKDPDLSSAGEIRTEGKKYTTNTGSYAETHKTASETGAEE